MKELPSTIDVNGKVCQRWLVDDMLLTALGV